MHRVALIFIALWMAPSARAESRPPTCNRGWWEPQPDAPLQLDAVPKKPMILLAVKEPYTAWGLGGEMPALSTLGVEVTDSSGQRVEGELEVVREPNLHQAWVSKTVRWRALTQLVVGERYTIDLTVPDSPTVWNDLSCPPHPGFTNRQTFVVAETPPESPHLDLSVTVAADWASQITHNLCEAAAWDARCLDRPEVCCGYSSLPLWTSTATVLVSGPMPPPLYAVIQLTFERHNPEWEHQQWSKQTASYTEPVVVSVQEPGDGIPPDGSLCVTAKVYTLMRDRAEGPLAEVRRCPDTSRFTRSPKPVLTECHPWSCATFVAVEPGPEVSDGAELADGADLTADPSWDDSPSGCSGGGSTLFGLLLVLVAHRRLSRRQPSPQLTPQTPTSAYSVNIASSPRNRHRGPSSKGRSS